MPTDRPDTEPGGARRRGGRLIVLAALLALAGGGAVAAEGTLGGSEVSDEITAHNRTPAQGAPAGQEASEADPEAVDPLAPLPEARPNVVEPVAGEASDDARPGAGRGRPKPVDSAKADMSLPEPDGPASSTGRPASAPGVSDLAVDRATALPNGVALPPLEAPEAVLQVIRAGNTIARTPYKWGGGHGRFKDNGYDCSGSVSYALYAAGLLDKSYTSGELMRYGAPGKGKWITLYANAGHVFMEVAGIRFDTSGAQRTGSRWQNEFRSTGGYVARHPPGL